MPEEPDWGHVRFLENAVIAHEQLWADFFARSGVVPLEVRYEDLVASYEKTIRRVLDFLDVELPPDADLPPPRLKKQADEATERLAEEYRAQRDNVEPRQLNLRDKRVGIVPRPVQGTGAAPPPQPSAP
jgi:LPS sulfotransferase NodH